MTTISKASKSSNDYDKHSFDRPGAGRRIYDRMDNKLITALSHRLGQPVGTTILKLESYLQDLSISNYVNTRIPSRKYLSILATQDLALQIRRICRSQAAYARPARIAREEPAAEGRDYARALEALVTMGMSMAQARETVGDFARTKASPDAATSMPRHVPLPTDDSDDEQETGASSSMADGAGADVSTEAGGANMDERQLRSLRRQVTMGDSTHASAEITGAEAETPDLTSPHASRQLFQDAGLTGAPLPTKEPEWVDKCLQNATIRPMAYENRTPWKKEGLPATIQVKTALDLRIEVAMARNYAKVDEDHPTYFESYDADDPLRCVPEGVRDTETRIFIWFLLVRVFIDNASNFKTVVKYDVKGFIMKAWHTLYCDKQSTDDDDFIAYRAVKLHQNERFQDFLERISAMVRDLNAHGLHFISPDSFQVHMYKILSTSGPWWTNLVQQAEINGWSLEEATRKFTYQSANTALSEQSHKAIAGPSKETKAMLARIAVLEDNLQKANAAGTGSGKPAHVSQMGNNRSNTPPGHCFAFWRFSACPQGGSCRFTHDSKLGNPSNAQWPTWYVCFFCKKTNDHWGANCNTAEAQIARSKREQLALDKEIAKSQRSQDGNQNRGGGRHQGKGKGKGGGRGNSTGAPGGPASN
jgi:hypothetical protein